MARPTNVDIVNAGLYGLHMYLKKRREEKTDNYFDCFGKGSVLWEDLPYPYKCPMKECPYGRYIFTKSGCETTSCPTYRPFSSKGYMKDVGDVRYIKRENRVYYNKFCYLDAFAIGTEDSKRIVRYTPGSEVMFEQYKDIPDVQKHIWAKLKKTDSSYKCFVDNIYIYYMAYFYKMDLLQHDPTNTDKENNNHYDKLYDVYGKNRPILYGTPLPSFNEDYCAHRVAISYDPQSMECYQKVGQTITETFLLGSLYKEIWVRIHGFRN